MAFHILHFGMMKAEFGNIIRRKNMEPINNRLSFNVNLIGRD